MSVNLSSLTWRLRTPGGIPVKLISRRGSVTDEHARATEIYIIRADRLVAFLAEYFPPPFPVIEGIQHRLGAPLPAWPVLRATNVEWESHTDGKPVDPFADDPLAPEDTYEQNLRVTVTYETVKEPDPNDPKTFLEVSAEAGGTWLTVPVRGEQRWGNTGDPEDYVRDPNLCSRLFEPEIEWSIRWRQIPYWYFDGLLKARLQSLIGHVNSEALLVLNGAPAETVLFLGYSASQQYTWRDQAVLPDDLPAINPADQPYMTLSLKFLERNFLATDGTQVNHNMAYRPGEGYQRLLIDGINPVYPSADLNTMFAIEVDDDE